MTEFQTVYHEFMLTATSMEWNTEYCRYTIRPSHISDSSIQISFSLRVPVEAKSANHNCHILSVHTQHVTAWRQTAERISREIQ